MVRQVTIVAAECSDFHAKDQDGNNADLWWTPGYHCLRIRVPDPRHVEEIERENEVLKKEMVLLEKEIVGLHNTIEKIKAIV